MQFRVYCPHADSVTNEVNCLSSVFFWVHILGVIRIDASVYYIYLAYITILLHIDTVYQLLTKMSNVFFFAPKINIGIDPKNLILGRLYSKYCFKSDK